MNFSLISEDELAKLTSMIEGVYREVRDVVKKSLNPLEEKWLDNEDAARLLKISPRTLQNHRDNGTLPFSMIGGKVYYKASDIDEVLRNNYKSKR